MLTYRFTSIVFLILAVVLIPLSFYFSWANFALLIVLVSYIGLLVYGSANIRSGFYLKAICHGLTREKIIAITFDDGPDPKYTPAVLDFLKSRKLPATFFIIGKNISGNEEILRRIMVEGHLTGNHSYSHSRYFDFYPSGKMIRDLKRAEDILAENTGRIPGWFRPPFGVTTPSVRKSADIMRYNVIGWNIRTLDTTIRNKEKIMQRIRKRIKPGAVILFHDTQPSIVEILEYLADYTNEIGYRIVPLDKLLRLKAYKS
jgi:peptidoglycan/xylan/chitin deacetylase (PgdA/CDA1 family)